MRVYVVRMDITAARNRYLELDKATSAGQKTEEARQLQKLVVDYFWTLDGCEQVDVGKLEWWDDNASQWRSDDPLAEPLGPTKNPIYNHLLVKWGTPDAAECEICDADLTGKDVHEAYGNWVGDCCAPEKDSDGRWISDHGGACDESYHERRQMGLTAI